MRSITGCANVHQGRDSDCGRRQEAPLHQGHRTPGHEAIAGALGTIPAQDLLSVFEYWRQALAIPTPDLARHGVDDDGVNPATSLENQTVDITLLSPLVSILSGIAILVWPRLLSYIVAFYLILFGLMEIIPRLQIAA
ncbi:MAG: DUF3096 domain-containing protein [Chromatiaceae bacterium]|nr:DUF3096 domain-containing protein [Chromatiaceae bacterium]MCP5314476.1 DUF3096 domain-containing protein [Chromatiaceae bacterium]